MHRKLTAADKVALIALAGVLTALVVWISLAYLYVVLVPGEQTLAQVVSTTEPSSVSRFSAVVAVLIATLLVQSIYARRLRLYQRLQREVERSREMYEHSPQPIIIMDRDYSVRYANPAAREMDPVMAHCAEVGEACHARRGWGPSCEDCMVTQVFDSAEQHARSYKEKTDRGEEWYEQTAYPVLNDDDQVESAIVTFRDVTDRASAERAIHRMAYYDPVTDLPNRTLFMDRLQEALARGARNCDILVVAFIDLNDFKAINDTFGHAIGDGVLKAVGHRLSASLRAEDTVARHSGDEFTVLAVLNAESDVPILVRKLMNCMIEPVTVEGHELSIGASAGVSLYPFDGLTADEMIKNADTAMYKAKGFGYNAWQRYEPEMSQEAVGRLGIEAALRHALANDEFELYYQPQVDITTGIPIGVEALIRWNHPERGLLTPDAFLPIAEQSGLMAPIGRWVLHEACTQMRRWLDDGFDIGRVAVNLSPQEFTQQNIVALVRRALADYELEPHRLELEITEHTALQGTKQVLFTFANLRSLGVRVAVDDFGTGYSAMSYLKRFPISTLKIAQAFMRDVHRDRQSAAIATMIIQLCRELELDVVAEGVENDSQLEFLRESGCTVVQGNIYSVPIPAAALEAEYRPLLQDIGERAVPGEICS